MVSNKIAAQIPRGHRNIADQLLRSASHTVLYELATGTASSPLELRARHWNCELAGQLGSFTVASARPNA